jgi:DNA adenine methylase
MDTYRLPFNRTGSKLSLIPVLKKYIPADYETYIEPFFGGGSVFWRLIDKNKRSILNDIDADLIRALKILKRGISENEIESYKIPNSLAEQEKIVNTNSNRPIDIYARYFYKSNGTFSGKGIGRQYKQLNIMNRLKSTDIYKDGLKNATIANGSYESILKNYDSPKSFFFIDPPYEKSQQLYSNFNIDYEKLRDLLEKLRGKFILTINDSPVILEIFKQFKIKRITVKSNAGGRPDGGIGLRDRRELIISNY